MIKKEDIFVAVHLLILIVNVSLNVKFLGFDETVGK